jgi:hypothetical protein
LKSDELKRSHRSVYEPDPEPARGFGRAGKRKPLYGFHGPLKGIIWSSIQAYFGKQENI